jgi:hypothetical protein
VRNSSRLRGLRLATHAKYREGHGDRGWRAVAARTLGADRSRHRAQCLRTRRRPLIVRNFVDRFPSWSAAKRPPQSDARTPRSHRARHATDAFVVLRTDRGLAEPDQPSDNSISPEPSDKGVSDDGRLRFRLPPILTRLARRWRSSGTSPVNSYAREQMQKCVDLLQVIA